jgi:hypothetical protein
MTANSKICAKVQLLFETAKYFRKNISTFFLSVFLMKKNVAYSLYFRKICVTYALHKFLIKYTKYSMSFELKNYKFALGTHKDKNVIWVHFPNNAVLRNELKEQFPSVSFS